MRIVILKSSNIEGDVVLLDSENNENQVSDYYQEFNLPDSPGSPMELIFTNLEKVFIPNGPGDVFMDGGIYTIMQLTGNELLIKNDNNIVINPELKWTALE